METSISYLRRDSIFDYEKPFDVDLPVSHIPKARVTNHQNDERNVVAHPLTDATQFSLEKHGFCIIQAKTNLNRDLAFKRKREVQKDYWYEIEAILHENFPHYSRIECYDFTIRKRDPDFPINIRTYTNVEQPARRPHSDCTPRGAHMNLEHAFPDQQSFWEGKDFDIINVWRPLRGPNNDWPLAMCDWQTIDPAKDVRVNDAIRKNRVDENAILHYNENHKWYFMPNQTEEELIVFRNADSLGQRARESFNLDSGFGSRDALTTMC
ncbi:hypothetical protein CRV24_000858 [Beauveria bassiana]|nr:hypothetical protein CRV24_000858 [Beauveria bassiana]KAH8720582.1 Aspirochlorine biosynthesis protein N [Beauveria bassiana]